MKDSQLMYKMSFLPELENIKRTFQQKGHDDGRKVGILECYIFQSDKMDIKYKN